MSELQHIEESYIGKGRILRVKEGFNPNSSSLGSVVFSIPVAMVVAPVILSGAAALIAAKFAKKDLLQKKEGDKDDTES